MAEPIVFISHLAIKPGGLDGFRELQGEWSARLEAEKPRTLVFLPYLDEAGTNLTVIHVFGDADAMDAHFEGSDERARIAYEYLVPRGWEIYGPASDAVVHAMREAAASAGVTLVVQPLPLAGFLRLG